MVPLMRRGRGPVDHLIAAHDGAHAPVVRLRQARQGRPAAPKLAGLFGSVCVGLVDVCLGSASEAIRLVSRHEYRKRSDTHLL